MKAVSGKSVLKQVKFVPDKTKASRIVALTEILEKPASGTIHVAILLAVWGSASTAPNAANFVFGLISVSVIILCILRSLSIVKRLQLENRIALTLSVLQAILVGMAVGYSPDHGIIAVLSSNLMLACLPYPYNGLLSRISAAVVVAACHPLTVPLRIAACLSFSDVGFLGWSKYLEFKDNQKAESRQILFREFNLRNRMEIRLELETQLEVVFN